jgi:DNA-binding XRE family transcriptional regulator
MAVRMAIEGEIVAILRNRLGQTQDKLAEKAGVSKQTVINFEKGHVQPEQNTIWAIAAALNLMPGQFQRLIDGFKQDRDVDWLIVSYGEVAGTGWGEGQEVEQPKGRGVKMTGLLNGSKADQTFDPTHTGGNDELPLPLEWFPNCIAARIRGTSMSPKYSPGEWVILRKTTCEDARIGWDVYVELAGGENFGGTLKKIGFTQDNMMLLLPINDDDHQPIEAECSEVKSIYRAVGKYVPYVKQFGFDAVKAKRK